MSIADEIISVSQLLEGTCPGCPPKVYAYDVQMGQLKLQQQWDSCCLSFASLHNKRIIWSSSQVFTWPYSPAFLCHLSPSATPTWPSCSLCPTSEDYYGSDMSLCNHWPYALEPIPSFDIVHFINWSAKCLFSFSQNCSLLSGSLALERFGVHYKRPYINV